ncbi:hypothetical protein QT987_17145 [Microcoleus sp. SVA1B4]
MPDATLHHRSAIKTTYRGRSPDRVKYWQYADNNSYRSTAERKAGSVSAAFG